MASATNEPPNEGSMSNSYNFKIPFIFTQSPKQVKNKFEFYTFPRYKQFGLLGVTKLKPSDDNPFHSSVSNRPPIQVPYINFENDMLFKNIDAVKPTDFNSINTIFKKCPTRQKSDAEEAFYNCLKDQVCCDTGCCSRSSKRLGKFRSRRLSWVSLIVFIIFILCACYRYYKKLKIAKDRRQLPNCSRRLSISTPRTIESRNVAQPDLGMVSGPTDDILERIVPQYAYQLAHPLIDPHASTGNQEQQPVEINHQAAAQPPSYETLVDTISNHNHVLNNQEEEPPPVYLEACRLQSVNEGHDGKVEK